MFFAKFIIVILFALFQTSLCLNGGLSAFERVSYSVPYDCMLCDPKFNHFAIHNTTGDVYVGSSNKLAHLDSDLNEIKNVSTFVECGDGIDREDCINHNKILVIYDKQDALITCGNMRDPGTEGTCQVRNLTDISITDDNFFARSALVVPRGDQPTVSVIAPVRDEDRLYVATSDPFSNIHFYARRYLPGSISPLGVKTSTDALSYSSSAGSDFIVNPVDVFNYNSFTYFATNQRFDTSREFRNIISKLNRACHNSITLRSYTEVVIECRGSNGVNYNLIRSVHLDTVGADLADSIGVNRTEPVLIALFSKSVDPDDFTPDDTSAVCIYDLDDVEMRFFDAYKSCLAAGDSVGYLNGGNCERDVLARVTDDDIREDLCNFNLVSAEHPRGKMEESITSTAIMELPGVLGSTISTTTEEQHTITFIGTTTGDVLKVHLTNGNDRVYETLSLCSPVLNDVEFNKTGEVEELTVLTEQKIYKLLVSNCAFYTTGEDCIGVTAEDGDPYCGWCSLTRKCTRKKECDMADISTRWLSFNEALLKITNVSPYDSQPHSVQQEITITVEQLPELPVGQSYECIFDLDFNMTSNSAASKSGNNLTCMTPSVNDLPLIPEGEDHITILLSIKSTETGIKFVDTNLTYYNCGAHKRCLDCASSKWNCDWCTYGDKCTHNSATKCTYDSDMTLIAANEQQRANPSRRGPESCAQLEQQPGEVFIPSGVNRTIDVAVENLPDRFTDIMADEYTCILNINGARQESKGRRIGIDTIQCSTTQYIYEDNIQTLTSRLTVQWTWEGFTRTIDDDFGFNVTLFKCEVDRPDCSRCVSVLTTRPELRCGWCSDSELCAVSDHPQCGDIDSWIRETTDNEVASMNCPAPTISISPSSGPSEGNTLIDITGTNLGRNFSDIISVTVGGQECIFRDYESAYIVGKRIRCHTLPQPADTVGDVLVTISGIGNTSLTSEISDKYTQFVYRNPIIEQINPQYGPESGGTKVNITGDYLSAGREINITIRDAVCLLDRSLISDDELVCTTEESFAYNQAPVVISFDGAIRRSRDLFEYRENPTIRSVSPYEAFEAGGRIITIQGTNFNVVKDPKVRVVLRSNRKEYRQSCTVVNDNIMQCPSPAVELPTLGRGKRQTTDGDIHLPKTRPADQEPTTATLGFIMDGVRNLRDWSVNNNRSFQYYQNPNYTAFEITISEDDDVIRIGGSRVNLASSMDDVTVHIDRFLCSVTSLGISELVCTTPLEIRNCTGEDKFSVDIQQGNLIFDDIGTVYCNATETYYLSRLLIPVPLIAGISTIALLLLVLIILITIIYKYRVRYAREQTVKLLKEIDNLEESMGSKIRDAFAQLQLDLQDFTNDLEGTGMPFVSNEQYATNMLFFGLKSKLPTNDPTDVGERNIRAMTEFCKLLEDKNFLLALIRVLDEPRSAPAPVIRERTKFACFLTTLMIVENKLPYLTDVMLSVLRGYITEVVSENKAFQFCQRTETVGERLLTNWVSMCLFKYLKDQAAFPLFVLYRAILLQTERGPVDIVSGKAYYSLSEHYVLTIEDLEYSMINLSVVNNEDGECKPLQVTNLDTISQVKEKILDLVYRNKPYSTRPDASLVDLEWRQGNAGRLILRDSDNTTLVDEQYRQLNTLKHFKVPDQAKVAIVPKQDVPKGPIDSAKAMDVKPINPQVALQSNQQRARFTLYELSPEETDERLKTYHLEKLDEAEDFRRSLVAAKRRLSEQVAAAIKKREISLKKIHFPQLLTAKGSTQQYVNNMFEAVLDQDHIPKPVKHVFDFLEAEARTNNITDQDIIHKWKSNCLPLRFWVTIINNPQYIFDIRESRSVTSSMSVVGQAFFNAFNRTDYTHSKQTGFNRLLYHRELDGFQSSVDKYYTAVNDLPPVSKTEIEEELNMISQQFSGIFSKMSVLQQLYQFVKINNEKLVEALKEDETCRKARLSYKLESIAVILEGQDV